VDTAGHTCLLPFDTDDPEFARGFEVGRIWNALRAAPEETITEFAHASNVEMVMRLAEATDRKVAAVELDGEWLEATFSPSRG
jgi:hypothetical protein